MNENSSSSRKGGGRPRRSLSHDRLAHDTPKCLDDFGSHGGFYEMKYEEKQHVLNVTK